MNFQGIFLEFWMKFPLKQPFFAMIFVHGGSSSSSTTTFPFHPITPAHGESCSNGFRALSCFAAGFPSASPRRCIIQGTVASRRLHCLAAVARPERGTTPPGATHGESTTSDGAQVRFGQTQEAVIQWDTKVTKLSAIYMISEIRLNVWKFHIETMLSCFTALECSDVVFHDHAIGWASKSGVDRCEVGRVSKMNVQILCLQRHITDTSVQMFNAFAVKLSRIGLCTKCRIFVGCLQTLGCLTRVKYKWNTRSYFSAGNNN